VAKRGSIWTAVAQAEDATLVRQSFTAGMAEFEASDKRAGHNNTLVSIATETARVAWAVSRGGKVAKLHSRRARFYA